MKIRRMKKYRVFALFMLIIMMACSEKEDPVKEEIIPEIDIKVSAITIDANNTIWVGTSSGLYMSVETGYKPVPLSVNGGIASLYYEGTENTLWIGTETALIKASVNQNTLTETAVISQELSNPKVHCMHIDSDERTWVGTETGISLNQSNTWKKENFRISPQEDLFPMDIEDYTINSIASWEGDYFFATSGIKLYRAFDYDESVDAFSGATQWDPPYNGLSITDTMFVVFIDAEGKKWMGGTEGIQVHTGHDPKDHSSFSYYYDELPDPHALAISQAPNGDIWVGTRKGIAVFNGTNWEVITEGLPDPFITAIAFGSDNKVWIGTKKGLVNIR